MKLLCSLLLVLFFGTASGQIQDDYKNFKITTQDGKSGITYQDRIVLPCEYEEIVRQDPNSFRIKQNHKYGLVSIYFHQKRQRWEQRGDIFTVPVKKGYLSVSQTLPCEYDKIEKKGSA